MQIALIFWDNVSLFRIKVKDYFSGGLKDASEHSILAEENEKFPRRLRI